MKTRSFAVMLRRSSLFREFRRPLEFGIMAEHQGDDERGNRARSNRNKSPAEIAGWLRRSSFAQGQASAISVFAPSIAASSIGAKLCGRSGGVEAMVMRP